MASRELTGVRVLITGGSSGIGLATARALDGAGAQTVLLARGEEGLIDAAGSLPGCAGTIAADVSHADAALRGVQEASAMLGGLDVVVSGAGAGAYGPFLEMTPDDYERTIATTLLGTMNIAHAAVPELALTGGTLVVIGSVAGRLPVPWLAAYTAAKHGVRGFVRALHAELRAQGRPVSVTLIAPGPVDTPFWTRAPTPDRRLPPEVRGAYRADDVAQEVLAAIRSPGRLERTIGAAMLVPILIDAIMPNAVQVPLSLIARLGWRAREHHERSGDDGLRDPARSARISGGLTARSSMLEKVRRLGALGL
jgi:short-subunit dehydrogenase